MYVLGVNFYGHFLCSITVRLEHVHRGKLDLQVIYTIMCLSDEFMWDLIHHNDYLATFHKPLPKFIHVSKCLLLISVVFRLDPNYLYLNLDGQSLSMPLQEVHDSTRYLAKRASNLCSPRALCCPMHKLVKVRAPLCTVF